MGTLESAIDAETKKQAEAKKQAEEAAQKAAEEQAAAAATAAEQAAAAESGQCQPRRQVRWVAPPGGGCASTPPRPSRPCAGNRLADGELFRPESVTFASSGSGTVPLSAGGLSAQKVLAAPPRRAVVSGSVTATAAGSGSASVCMWRAD